MEAFGQVLEALRRIFLSNLFPASTAPALLGRTMRYFGLFGAEQNYFLLFDGRSLAV